MNWIGHQVSTLILAVVLVWGLLHFGIIEDTPQTYEYAAMFIALAVFAALIPDMDAEHSKMSQYLKGATIVLAAAVAYTVGQDLVQQAIIFIVIAVPSLVCQSFFRPRHRGFVHSHTCGCIVAIVISLSAVTLLGCSMEMGMLIFAGIGMGYFCHLLEDGYAIKLK